MDTKIFINLPVKDLNKSVTFFSKLGYTFNQHLTNENATCIVISKDTCIMLLEEPFFNRFTPRKIADTTKTTEVLICISTNSRQAVDELVTKAVNAGGSIYKAPQVHGDTMYGHSFQDLDGHLWEVMWMCPTINKCV